VGINMKHKLVVAAVAMLLLPAAAQAQERVGDAALGALSGAVVLGPVGAVAGALVGFTAGPHIAGAWGVRHGRRTHRARAANTTSQTGVAAADTAPSTPARVGSAQPAQAAPVGVSAVAAAPSAEQAHSVPMAAPSPAGTPNSVPVQGFE
jgi:hypothetical protein